VESLDYVHKYIESSINVKKQVLSDEELLGNILRVVELCTNAIINGNKVLLAGNGGSAADAQHIAAEFVSRFFYDRPGLPAFALTTDTSILTAVGNDYGYELVFARQVQAVGNKGDVFIGLSTSGNSKNIIAALDEAQSKGIHTIGLCGNSGAILDKSDICLSVPNNVTPYIQESHIMIGHIICALIERNMFPQED
jgi:D-sedoheptulose 7-phosphate isomerase